MANDPNNFLTYHNAGVDIDTGNALVKHIKSLAIRTARPGIIAGIGGFSALFEMPKKYREPVLVSGTDGVGTKLRLAFDWNRHDTVGIDLVAMSVNDILTQGADPLFFLDYFACGKLSLEITNIVMNSIVKGCELAGCALVGGETAEMPGMYPNEEYDLAGFAVGVVEKSDILINRSIRCGNKVLGLASSGAHANGYSLIRKIIEHSNTGIDCRYCDYRLSDLIMEPTRIYVKSITKSLAEHGDSIKGLAHITGGGLLENIQRILPSQLCAVLHRDAWHWPIIFQWLQRQGQIKDNEMYRVFNCGIGMAMIVEAHAALEITATLQSHGEVVSDIGEIIECQKNMVQTVIK